MGEKGLEFQHQPPSIIMSGKIQSMTATAVGQSHLLYEPLQDRLLSGFEISALVRLLAVYPMKAWHGENWDTPESHRSEH